MRLLSWIIRKRLLDMGFYDVDILVFKWYQYHTLFFNSLIFKGLKLRAFNTFCQVKFGLKENLELDPQFIFFACLLAITPDLMLKPLRLGSVTYGVPVPITDRKQVTFVLKWTIKLLRDKHNNRNLKIPLLIELLLASYCNQGEAFNKLQDIYKTAADNRHLVRRFYY